jgi:hypothetical protein
MKRRIRDFEPAVPLPPKPQEERERLDDWYDSVRDKFVVDLDEDDLCAVLTHDIAGIIKEPSFYYHYLREHQQRFPRLDQDINRLCLWPQRQVAPRNQQATQNR